jgi:cell wall-associated NlpC family hydrolase
MEKEEDKKKAGEATKKASSKRPRRTAKLRFSGEEPEGRAVRGAARKGGRRDVAAPPSGRRPVHDGRHRAGGMVKSQIAGRIETQDGSDEEDSVSRQAFCQGKDAGAAAGRKVYDSRYGSKLRRQDKAAKLEQAGKVAEQEGKAAKSPSSNPLSRWRQKQEIKKQYAAARSAGNTGKSAAAKGAKSAGNAARETGSVMERLAEFASKHTHVILIVLLLGLVIMVICGFFSSCSLLFAGGSNTVTSTSFVASDEEIRGADADYGALEAALRSEVAHVERDHSGYDEYRYHLDEIGHDPYRLTSYLTVRYGGYTSAEVQGALRELFGRQYKLELREETETRTRSETRIGTRLVVDRETGRETEVEYEYEVEVEYEYRILHVDLDNRGLAAAVEESGFDSAEKERYGLLLQTRGNRPYLFQGDIYANASEAYLDYEIPAELLTDIRFANMVREAEKYLGYAYVWGGSTPEGGFDCSGFVSYVLNHCGNGWSVGRQTVNGLLNLCTVVSKDEMEPGDLIFFQGTYDTAGASHVGIYVGGGMMLHCGSPVSYASVEAQFWKDHYLCVGRLP